MSDDVLCPTCGALASEPCNRDAGKECAWPDWSRRRLAAAAPDMASALADLVQTFHARPDILRLCGFHENAQIKAACDALNKAGVRP